MSLYLEVQHFLDLADQELRRVAIIANQTRRFHKQASFPRDATSAELFATVVSIYEGRLRNSGINIENEDFPVVRFAASKATSGRY